MWNQDGDIEIKTGSIHYVCSNPTPANIMRVPQWTLTSMAPSLNQFKYKLSLLKVNFKGALVLSIFIEGLAIYIFTYWRLASKEIQWKQSFACTFSLIYLNQNYSHSNFWFVISKIMDHKTSQLILLHKNFILNQKCFDTA